ncbi:hypothetical protein SDC9_129846 [bioreactor metagenome]|uniref:Uncharacterized protein n=1 Tax=bioreactor metagenome TaxID=1076179 RepID=A0A645D0N9_9ZZZZ
MAAAGLGVAVLKLSTNFAEAVAVPDPTSIFPASKGDIFLAVFSSKLLPATVLAALSNVLSFSAITSKRLFKVASGSAPISTLILPAVTPLGSAGGVGIASNS